MEEEKNLTDAFVDSWYQRIPMPDGTLTPGVQDSQGMLRTLDSLGLPADMTGKRVLDVGCGEGYFAFECEKRGAEIRVVELRTSPLVKGFDQARKWYNSSAVLEFTNIENGNLYMTDPGLWQDQFDYIFLFGVIYHLRNPLVALDNLFAMAKPGALIFIESHMLDGAAILDKNGQTGSLQTNIKGTWQLVEDLNGDGSCYWFPSKSGLEAALKRAGFMPVGYTGKERGIMVAKRLPEGITVDTEEYVNGILRMQVRTGTYRPVDRGVVAEVQTVYGQQFIDYEKVKTAVDVGSHIGSWTRYVLARNPNAEVIAVEPDPENFAMLTLNTADYPTVRRLNGGMGFISGQAYIGTHDLNSGGHVLFDESHLSVVRADPHRTISRVARVWTLEQLIEMAGAVDVLKLDCEGAEISAIAQTPDEFIRRCQWIVGEYHSPPARFENEFAVRLQAVGFELLQVDHHEPHNLTTFVAKRKDTPAPSKRGRKAQSVSGAS